MIEMGFTYGAYINYLNGLKEAGYALTNFANARDTAEPKAIIRHDIDLSPQYAVKMAELEHENGCSSTYMVMLSSSLYNLLDRENERSILRIAFLRHEIGLHFDVTKYEEIDEEGLRKAILRELDLLSAIIGERVISMSWHMPRKDLIGKRLDYLARRGIRNAYDPEFFADYKYCSDSMMRWRDPLADYIDREKWPRLQMLTHPIWYTDEERGGTEKMNAVFARAQAENAAYLERTCPGMLNLAACRKRETR